MQKREDFVVKGLIFSQSQIQIWEYLQNLINLKEKKLKAVVCRCSLK